MVTTGGVAMELSVLGSHEFLGLDSCCGRVKVGLCDSMPFCRSEKDFFKFSTFSNKT